jgi:hypothetical protein
VPRSRSHELPHAGKKYLIESAGLIHKRMPCTTIVSVEVSETAIMGCCLPREEDANAGPSSVDGRSSDHTAREPATLFLEPEGHHGYRGPCMTVVPVEVSKTAGLECCPLHEEDANVGPSSVDQRSSDHTTIEPSSLFPYSDGHNGYCGLCMLFHA